MDPLTNELNELLVTIYQSIGRMEEQMLKSDSRIDLSISEMHFIEAVGSDRESYPNGKTISNLSQELGITLSSVTLAANKLIKKGYLLKEKSTLDGRVAHITLTREGEKMYRIHRLFHKKMVDGLLKEMSGEQKSALLAGIRKLSKFFEKEVAHT